MSQYTPRIPVEERFWSKVNFTYFGCWEWIGHIDSSTGYGRFQINRKSIPAQKVSFALFYGIDISVVHGSGNIKLLHSCNNGRCVYPEHLYIGTYSDNMVDRLIAGNFGKVNANDIRAIKEKYSNGLITQKELAVEYNMTQGSISRIINDKTYQSLAL